jgi:tight adherence protein C
MENLIQYLQGSLGNPENLIFLSMFMAVVLLVMGGVTVFAGGNPVKRRLKTRVQSVGSMAAGNRQGLNLGKGGKKLARKNMEKKKAAEADPVKVSGLRRKLVMAGYMGSSAVPIFQMARFSLAAILPVSALVAIPFIFGSLPPSKLAVSGVMAAVLGFYLPSLWVGHRTNARQTESRQGFPDALDMLLVCVEAGLSLAAALNRVGQEIGTARPLLGEHFRLVALEMQAGKSREEALRNMADRIGIAEVGSLVTLLLQSEALGTSIGLSLRVHADEMRRKRLVRAEEKGNKLPTKMAIPLIVFILPALMSVILTPLIIRFIRIVAPAMAGEAS